MAAAFARGGTLIPFGAGAAATDAAHAAVEFMHPVIVGKRALPAVAPNNDPTGLSTAAGVGRPGDIALALCHSPADEAAERFLAEAGERGLLTIAITGGRPASAEHSFEVAADDPVVVQEVSETAYHVLWELVHVFLEQPGLTGATPAHGETCITCGDVAVQARVAEVQGPTAIVKRDGAFEQVATDLIEGVARGDVLLCHAGVAIERVAADDETDFLYPFQAGGAGADLNTVLADVEASSRKKSEETIALRSAIETAAVEACGLELRARLERGGRLIAFGNGGSATDAQDLAAGALTAGWPAIALGNDAATVTAVANDVGVEQVFARQLIALGGRGDVAVGISTSGGSANVIAGLEQARAAGMATVALGGYDGGRFAELDWLDHLFVVSSSHIPRIQEAQATIYHLLLDAIGAR